MQHQRSTSITIKMNKSDINCVNVSDNNITIQGHEDTVQLQFDNSDSRDLFLRMALKGVREKLEGEKYTAYIYSSERLPDLLTGSFMEDSPSE